MASTFTRSADSPTSMPPIEDLPEHYRVWQREDGLPLSRGRGVYKATDLRNDETVALRFFDAGPRTPDAVSTLAAVAARLAQVGSPLIAPLRDFFACANFDVSASAFIDGESLAERVQRAGPLTAGATWEITCHLLAALSSLHGLGIAHGHFGPTKILFPRDGETDRAPRLVGAGLHLTAAVASEPSAGSDATREDLRRLGTTLWFAMTGHNLDTTPGTPLSWQHLEAAGITPELGILPVLLARTLTGEPAQRPATAPALLETLNVLAPLRSAVPISGAMPSGPSAPDPLAPTPKPRPPIVEEEGELWTRTTRQLSAPNRRRRKARSFWTSLALLTAGGAAGFFVGVAYEKNHRWLATFWDLHSPPALGGAPTPRLLLPSTPTPDPGLPLPPSPAVSAAGSTARLERIRRLQPDVSDVLRYARELRRVATLPVADESAFPSGAQVTRLLERFDWRDPASPNFHRTPLLLVLDYSNEHPTAPGQETSRQCADALAQALTSSGITSPIYACGLGGAEEIPEIEAARTGGGRFVEVWVAFTLF